MKIYVFPPHSRVDHTSGVDFARVIQPSKYFSKDPDIEIKMYDVVADTQKDNGKRDDWITIGKDFDIIFFNYILNDWGYAHMACYNRKYGHKMVLDVDDNLWGVLPDNSSYEDYKKGSQNIKNFTAICRDVDIITCTNSYLRNVIHHNTGVSLDKIKVFPNYIDYSLYNSFPEPRDKYDVVIGHMGSTTHFDSLCQPDFMQGMDRIMKDYPNVKFRTIGHLIPKYKSMWGARYENSFGAEDLYNWAKLMPQKLADIDFLVVPLSNNLYNRCKSSIKFLEAASAKRTGVWQNLRQYQEVIDGDNGFLAGNSDSWYNSIKILIDNKKRRNDMAEKAYKDVQVLWQMKDHAQQYIDLFKSLI